MARTRQKQKQKQQRSRLELLPVELQLAILGNLSSCDDLTSLIIASRPYKATYLRHKKLILSQVTQATLGDVFIDACMLYHWEHNIDDYTEDEDDAQSSMLLQWQNSLGSHQPTENEVETRHATHAQPWPRGPYRHIQLKFLHDYDKLAMDATEDQVKFMRDLLTVDDFSRILYFHTQVIRPLSALVAFSFPVRRDGFTGSNRGLWDTIYEARPVTITERQRIMQTLYRFQICCRLYAPRATPEDQGIIDMGQSHPLAMASDFFSRYDLVENEEFQAVHMVVVWELHNYFGIIKNDREWKKMMTKRYQETGMLRWTHYHPTTMEPVGVYGVTAGALSKGLELLMRIELATHTNEVAAELVASDPPHLGNFMWDTLRRLRDFYHFKTAWSVMWPESWSDEFWE